MKLATWNINGLRARLDFLLLWLEERQPDVVGLQELKCPDEEVPLLELKSAGYPAICHGQKAWNGVAVLTRDGADPVQVGLPGQEELGARLLAVENEVMTFVTVYCPNGKDVDHDDFTAKLAWFDALQEWIESEFEPTDPVVLCGDFNIVPEAIDTWNERALAGGIFHTEAERDRYRRFLDWGFHDVYRMLEPDAPGYSWWDYRFGAFHRGQGLRIDAILATQSLMERAQNAFSDREWRKKHDGLTASDHAPVVAEFE